jgi:hypothetical protein
MHHLLVGFHHVIVLLRCHNDQDHLTPCPCASYTVFDNVRSNVPHMLLDDVFTAKEEIATSVKEELVRQPALVTAP